MLRWLRRGGRAVDRSTRGLQTRWEREYQEKDLKSICWYQDHVPEQLVDLVEGGSIPSGLALDLGCGPGVSTAYLAASRKTIGLDIARSGLSLAQQLATERNVEPVWVVAATPHLPFRDSSFAFVFERGTMQQLPYDLRPDHLREVARVLKPGGLLQFIGLRGTGDRLENLRPGHLRLESIESFAGPIFDEEPRRMTHALLRRV